jgi:uncharacterized repeat protein (TIGR03837 family)
VRVKTADIFCRVVDNYGDIGVTLRLARQLVAEYGLDVRLFVDDMASFDKIAGELKRTSKNPQTVLGELVEPPARIAYARYPSILRQAQHGQSAGRTEVLRGVIKNKPQYQRALPSVYHWKNPPNGEFVDFKYTADIVIEAFACEIPATYLSQMAAALVKPMWINLEYLSAESWVASHHLLPSPHPRYPMTKYFFFPGFDAKSGGLIREKTIQPVMLRQSSTLSVFAFGYDSPRLNALIEVVVADANVSDVVVAEGVLANTRAANDKIQIVPFVAQPDFDQLLAAHDFLIVRGEDSFVRAQYAGRPFIWQIYPQEEAAHLVKLNAFLDLYCDGMSPALATCVCELSAWLSGADLPDTPQQYWQNAGFYLTEWQHHALRWQRHLLKQPDMATNLMAFYQKSLII